MTAVILCFYNKRLSESRAIEQNQENPMGAGWTAYFQLLSAFFVGNEQLPGFQRVISLTFPAKRYTGSTARTWCLCAHLMLGHCWPGLSRDHQHNARYCRVLLLLSFYTSTDSGTKCHDSALVSVLWEYDKDPPGAKLCRKKVNTPNYSNFRCFAQSGSWPAVLA
jgi:hypothetical protein